MIFEPICVAGVWRLRTNQELVNFYTDPNLVNVIKAGKIRWLGHVTRMEQPGFPKRSQKGSLEAGESKEGENVKKYLRNIGVRTWRRRTQDRKDWREVHGL
jgi:hypothetical protein